MSLVIEGPGDQARQLAGVTIGEGDGDAIWRQIRKSVDGIGGEARLRLFSVGDHRRPRLLEEPNGIAERVGVKGLEFVRCQAARLKVADGRNQFRGSRNASDGLGWNWHARSL